MTELALAFPLFSDADQEPSLGRRHQKLPQQNVFAYLPLRSYGFRFIIQGDFEVPSSREDVDSDKTWNQWLREEIPQLFVDALSVFMDHPSFSGLSSVASYFQFVPLEEEILDFFTPVARHILTLLQGKACVPVQMTNAGQEARGRYNWVLPSQAICCQDSTTQDLITPALLEEHLGLYYLHSDVAKALNPTLRSRLGIETISSKHLSEIAKAEVNKAPAENVASACNGDEHDAQVTKIGWLARWLQCMYRCLDQERNSSQDTLDLISSLSVIPLTDGTFVNLKGESVFLPLSMKQSSSSGAGSLSKKKKSSASEKTSASILESDLSTVHPALFTSLDEVGRSQVEQLLRRLGVKTWSAKDLINSHIIPTFNSGKWKAKSYKVLRSYVVYILEQRLSDQSVCDINELRPCVKIMTNKGPLNPEETPIHFTPGFGNAIDLARQLPSISWTLVDESYLDSDTGSKIHATDWKTFLAELGVQTFLSINKKRVKLHRSSMAQSPWASYERIWQTTPDGLYFVDDWSCEEFEEFLCKMGAPDPVRRDGSDECKVLAQYIDERWDAEYSQYADSVVHVKDSNGHTLGEARSSFYLNLVSKAWMSARGEGTSLFNPRDLFVMSDSVYKLLGDHVKYTAADLKTAAFKDILHIRQSISVDCLISEMKRWSSARSGESVDGRHPQEFTTSVAHMSEVYSFLSQRMLQSEEEKKKISEAFRKNALIFVPHLHPESSSSNPIHMKIPLRGSFYLKKDVCWRDPTDVASKYLKDHGKVFTRRLLQGYYHMASADRSITEFFIDQLNVDEAPNVDEYIEMASTVADVAVFPTRSALSDMLKIFSVLGRKCIARCHNDDTRLESVIDDNMATFLKQSLEREERTIFPSSGKWVSLSDKPLLADEKSLLKIFQNFKGKDVSEREGGEDKKKGVYFLDLGDLFEPQKQRSSAITRKAKHEREMMKENVSLFLKICEVKPLSECVKKEFIPTLVQFECIPLKRHFHRLMPHVQRFLYCNNEKAYVELNSQGFRQKLSEMKFASVDSLETVYSLSTHPDVYIPIKEKSGTETVGSTFHLYVVKNCLESADVLNAEIVKLLLGEKKQGSSELHNFLAAVRSYDGNDFEFFLEEVQHLDPLPRDEELWFVPPPEEPEVAEPEEDAPTEETPDLTTHTPVAYRSGDDGLHSWPPKSAAQYDKARIPERGLTDDSMLKMWPPPLPPESMKKSQENQAQERTTQLVGTERSHEYENRPKERDEKVEGIQRQNHPTRESEVTETPIEENIDHRPNRQKRVGNETIGQDSSADSAIGEGFIHEGGLPQDCPSHGNENTPQSMACLNPVSGDVSVIAGHEFQARQIPPSHAYLWFEGGEPKLDFEDLELNSHIKELGEIPPVESWNREDIGRWGEHCVYVYLLNQAKQLMPPGVVEIVWMNEKGNTILPYDLEIRQRVGVEKHVITYVEVKTTSSDQKEIFEISVQELKFALTKQQAFHLYRVFNAGTPGRLRIRRLQNLASQLDRKNVKLCLVI